MRLPFLLAIFSLLLAAGVTAAPGRRRRPSRPRGRGGRGRGRTRLKGTWTALDFSSVNLDSGRYLLGPNELGVSQSRPLGLAAPAPGAPGTAPVRYRQQRRSQLDANFGTDPAPPRAGVPPQYRAPVVPPDPAVTVNREGIRVINDTEREKMALEFFVRYQYTSHELTTKDTLIRQMQRNYGLEETGKLDDQTITLMMSPRCGNKDPSNYSLFPNRPKWTSSTVTYKLKGYSSDLSPCQTRNIMKRAFRVWEEVIEINFVEEDSDDADMIIYFGYSEHGDGYPFDGENGLLAHAFTAGTAPISGDTHFDEAEFWTLGSGRVFETYFGNANGAKCHFPFIFEGEEYPACTTSGRKDGLEWCATTSNYDDDRQWGFCPHELLYTYGGNSEGDPCVFPFTFLGRTYEQCTTDGRSDRYRWCSTTSNFDDDSKWGFCPDRAHATTGGNADGASCHFPFTFNGNEYSECTVVGRNDYRSWCATTADFDRDQKFGFCPSKGYSLFIVAAHEFGHAIGMDHSRTQGALMYPSYSYVENFRLPEDDTRGIRDLYGSSRRSRLAPLVLEQCGGDLAVTDGGGVDGRTDALTTPTPRPTTPSPRPTTHRPSTYPSTTERVTSAGRNDDLCGVTNVDAMLYLGSEIFVFKGKLFWRKSVGSTARGPYTIASQWPGGPPSVDAAYKRPTDGAVVLFKGKRHWAFNDVRLLAGYPRPLRDLGLPSSVQKLDAVLNWYRSKNRKRTYFFVGDEYYRYNEPNKRMDKRYPKPSSVWDERFTNLEASLESPTSTRNSLFFRRGLVHTLHNYKVKVQDSTRLAVWLGCEDRGAAPAPIVSRLIAMEQLPDRATP